MSLIYLTFLSASGTFLAPRSGCPASCSPQQSCLLRVSRKTTQEKPVGSLGHPDSEWLPPCCAGSGHEPVSLEITPGACVSASFQILPPTVYLRVTENIPQIIAFIEGIIARGHAYSTASGMAGGPWWSSEMQVTPGLCAATSVAVFLWVPVVLSKSV